jgi:hypothetical protein
MAGLIFDSFINSIPLWAWVTAAVLLAATLFYFFSPILLPIWAAMPKPLKIGLGVVGAVLAAWVGGKHAGRKTEQDLRKANDANAIKHRKEIDDEVRDMPAPAVDKRLNKWMRDE